MKKKKKPKSRVKILNELWSECIKLRAGYKSEISGIEGSVAAHHILGKSNHHLRFSLENGICILNQVEHFFGIHSSDPLKVEIYRARIKRVRGEDIYDKLLPLKQRQDKLVLVEVEEILIAELVRLKDELDT